MKSLTEAQLKAMLEKAYQTGLEDGVYLAKLQRQQGSGEAIREKLRLQEKLNVSIAVTINGV